MSARGELLLSTPTEHIPVPESELPQPGLPRVLKGIPPRGALSLDGHTAIHGSLPAAGAGRRRSAAPWLIDLVEQADLRGRGGGGFPTAIKLRAVASSRGRPIVVINASESEPASRKDRTLLESLPHLVLDGGQLAAQALRASELIIAICESAPVSQHAVSTAITERGASRREVRMRVATIPGAYVAGNETALVSHLNGGPAMPTFTPPPPFRQGVAKRPTLISNAETLAHVALIARRGPRWFRQLGTPAQPGSALVTLLGTPVAHPGVYEIEYGAPLHDLLQTAGGLHSQPRALLIGGYGGSWIGAEDLAELQLCDERLAPLGAALGAGVLLVLSREACPVAETVRMAGWLAGQSAGQCGPCVHGLGAIATSLAELAAGRAAAGAEDRVARLASLAARRGACAHPDGAASFVASALRTFAPEFADHARYGPCDACERPPELPLRDREPPLPRLRKPVAAR